MIDKAADAIRPASVRFATTAAVATPRQAPRSTSHTIAELAAANQLVDSTKFTQVRTKFSTSPHMPLRGDQGSNILRALCAHNFGLLQARLGGAVAAAASAVPMRGIDRATPAPLTPRERSFCAAMQATPWFLTHATPRELRSDDGQTLHLKSRQRVMDTSHAAAGASGSTEFPSRQAANLEKNAYEVEAFGNDHYVFLSLEPGAQPKKNGSRFGQVMYRIPLDVKALGGHSLMSLGDMTFSAARTSITKNYQHVPVATYFETIESRHHQYWQSSGLTGDASNVDPGPLDEAENLDAPEHRAAYLSALNDPDQDAEARHYGRQRGNLPDRCLFDATQSIEALAMAVVISARDIGDAGLSEALLRTDEFSLNTAVNSLFRPQIMVPFEFVSEQAARRQVVVTDP